MREHIGDIINGEWHYPVFREEYIPGHDAYSIDNDEARAYVATHAELRNLMAAANAQMHFARYEWELSQLLDEDGCDHSSHFDRSFDHCMRAAKLRDEAKSKLQVADDIDRDAYEWLVYTYLYDLATI